MRGERTYGEFAKKMQCDNAYRNGLCHPDDLDREADGGITIYTCVRCGWQARYDGIFNTFRILTNTRTGIDANGYEGFGGAVPYNLDSYIPPMRDERTGN